MEMFAGAQRIAQHAKMALLMPKDIHLTLRMLSGRPTFAQALGAHKRGEN